MTRQRHLNKAPIVEALVDIRVNPGEDYDAQLFITNTNQEFNKKYPAREPLTLFEGPIQMKLTDGRPKLSSPEDKGIQGFVYKSEDGKNVTQFRKDGFTRNRLSPYIDWEDVLKEAKYLWNIYGEIAKPRSITRIAVRYINRINVPLGNISDYINSVLTIPEGIPKNISHFLWRTTIEDTERELSANITEALEKSIEPQHMTVILDIDIYKNINFDVNEDSIWNIFEKMRELKNLIFFNVITEEAARRYDD